MLNCHFINARVELLTWETKHKFLSVLCWISLQCIIEKKKNLHVTVSIKHLFLQLYREKLQILICISHLQQCMHCKQEWTAVVLISYFPRGMIWEFPAVSSCQKAHRMIRGTTAKDSLRYSEHIVTISMLLQWTKNSLQDRWVLRDFGYMVATALMH